jgi:hypothetical protein
MGMAPGLRAMPCGIWPRRTVRSRAAGANVQRWSIAWGLTSPPTVAAIWATGAPVAAGWASQPQTRVGTSVLALNVATSGRVGSCHATAASAARVVSTGCIAWLTGAPVSRGSACGMADVVNTMLPEALPVRVHGMVRHNPIRLRANECLLDAYG